MIVTAAAAGAGAQQDALGPDHARRLHRRRRADRHGGGRPRRQRGGAEADRESGHQHGGGPAGRDHRGRRARRLRQRLDPDRGRRPGDPARGDPAVGEVELSDPPDRARSNIGIRTGAPASRASAPTIRRSPTGRSPTGRAHHDRRTSNSAGTGRRDRPDGLSATLSRAGQSPIGAISGQGRAAAGDRDARRQGADRLRTGPG